MTNIELLMSVSILVGLAIIRFGVPSLIIWLISKVFKPSELAA